MRSIARSKKTKRQFLEQTVGEIVLEASMLGVGCLINPMWPAGDEETGPPGAVVMIATGDYADELIQLYVQFATAKREAAEKEVQELPLFAEGAKAEDPPASPDPGKKPKKPKN